MKDFNEVRQQIGGIKGVMRALGDAPMGDHKWKSMEKCPFCGVKGKAGVFEDRSSHAELFKCHAPGCSSGNKVMAEVEYIACREGLSTTKPAEGGPSPAYERFLKMAGCWEEPKKKSDASGAAPAGAGHHLPEDLVANARRLVALKQSASVRLLRENLKIGQETVIALLDELERLGVVGPARRGLPRDILISKDLPSPDGVPTVTTQDGSAAPSEQILCEAIELFRMLSPGMQATPERLEKYLVLDGQPISAEKAGQIMATMRERGWLDAEDVPFKLPNKPDGLVVFKLNDEVSFEWSSVKRPPAPAAAKNADKGRVGSPEAEKLRPGLAALRWVFEQLPATDAQMVPFVPGGPLPDPISNEVLRRIKFKAVSFYEKRGITSKTCHELAFRANPRSNLHILQRGLELFGVEEMLAAGLYLEADRRRKLERRPNTQFCGKGQVGKKPESERRDDDDKWQWGWSEPVLIPYFDALGQLIKLRPHKGGAKSSTLAGEERIFVPRRYQTAGDTVEKFPEVVICEGEFKAVAIWQTIGAGAEEWFGEAPMGVCALPGISFAKSVAMREELDDWLREVECKKVYVAFDDEENGHKPMRQRFDAQIYARFLAEDIQRKLHITAWVVTLPREWRNARGKADWDGALAKLVQAEAVMGAVPAEEPPPDVTDSVADEWSNPE